ncbi:MAG: DUF3160 domain-containing protein, partial [Candidatus Kariarchaeaceae archaeon]
KLDTNNSTNGTNTTPITQGQIYQIEESQITSFGTYTPINIQLPNRGPDIVYKADLSDVYSIDKITDQRVRQMLSLQGFAVVESDYDQFYDIYKSNQESGYKQFITTDTLLHTFHVLYDYALRYIETNTFYTTLVELSEDMYDWNLSNYQHFQSYNLKDAFGRLVAFFGVGLKLLGVEVSIPLELHDLVQSEVSKIENHSEMTTSEITGNTVDFTQFIVRGHYTRSESLSKFFLTMMYYSQIAFFLQPDYSTENYLGIDQTRLALLLSLGIFSYYPLKTIKNWKLIYEPTTFFVGKADDLTALDYIGLLLDYSVNILEDNMTTFVNISILEDNSTVSYIIEEGKKLRSPLILGTVTGDPGWDNTTKGLRFMGQRFIPDSYFIQNLIDPVVASRAMPSGLDVMAVLNSTRALVHQQDDVEAYPEYLTKILDLQNEIDSWNSTAWTQNLYYLWLYTLLPLLNGKGEQYPSYMRSTAWADKELNTALGSWAELRHDTILYAKQTYTPLSAGRGFNGLVEANPELYGRLLSLTRMLQDGLEKRNLISGDTMGEKLDNLEDILQSLVTMSEKELRGESLSEQEQGMLYGFGYRLASLVHFPTNGTDQFGLPITEADDTVALIADVHTDPNSQTVLEVGIGKVYELLVILNDDDGAAYLGRGGVFSYYEFSQPMTQRLTDESWQALLETVNSPVTPTWTQSFVISKED